MNADVAVLYATDAHPASRSKNTFGHPVHQGFAERINANPVVFEIPSLGPLSGTVLECVLTGFRRSIPKHDVYFAEHTHTLYAAPLIKNKYPESKLIFGALDHRIYGGGAYRFEGRSIRSFIRRFDRKLDHRLLRKFIDSYVDGIIAYKGPIAEAARSLGTSVPVRTIQPYILPERYESFAQVSPDLESKTAIMIGTALDYKGPDILVKAWPQVRKEHPDAELYIIGPGHPNSYSEIKRVNLTGYLSDSELMNQMSNASLYVHPARAEAFGITVLEAMRAGIPPIVTRTTGARSAVGGVDRSLITETNPRKLADRISEYFSTSNQDRQRLSERAREQSKDFDKESRTEEFATQFESLLQELYTDGLAE